MACPYEQLKTSAELESVALEQRLVGRYSFSPSRCKNCSSVESETGVPAESGSQQA